MFFDDDIRYSRKATLARDRSRHGAYDPVRLGKLPAFLRRRATITRHRSQRAVEGDKFANLHRRDETHDDAVGDISVSSADSLTPTVPMLPPDAPSGSGSATSKFSNTDGRGDTIIRDYTTVPASPEGAVNSIPSTDLGQVHNATLTNADASTGSVQQTTSGATSQTAKHARPLTSILVGTIFGIFLVVALALLFARYRRKKVWSRIRSRKPEAKAALHRSSISEAPRADVVQISSPGFRTEPFRRRASEAQSDWVNDTSKSNQEYVAYRDTSQHSESTDRIRSKELPSTEYEGDWNLSQTTCADLARSSVLDMSLGTIRSPEKSSPEGPMRWSVIPKSRQLDGSLFMGESPNYHEVELQRRCSQHHTALLSRPYTSPARVSSTSSFAMSSMQSQTSTPRTKKILDLHAHCGSLTEVDDNTLGTARSIPRLAAQGGPEITKQGSSLLIRNRSYSDQLRRPLSQAGASLASALGMRPKLLIDTSGSRIEDDRNVICIDTDDMIARDGNDAIVKPAGAASYEPHSLPLSNFHLPSSFARRVARKYPSLPELYAVDEVSDSEVDRPIYSPIDQYEHGGVLSRRRSHLGSCFSGHSTHDSKITSRSNEPSPCASFTFEIQEVKKNPVGSKLRPEDMPRNVSVDLFPKAQAELRMQMSDVAVEQETDTMTPHGLSRLRHCVASESSTNALLKGQANDAFGETTARLADQQQTFVHDIDWDLRSVLSAPEAHPDVVSATLQPPATLN